MHIGIQYILSIDAPPPPFRLCFFSSSRTRTSYIRPQGQCALCPLPLPLRLCVLYLHVSVFVFRASCSTFVLFSGFADAWVGSLFLRVSCHNYAPHDVRVTFAARLTYLTPLVDVSPILARWPLL